MLSKKAQGISINTIIIAAIALIVLVVLVMIFTGRLGLFSKGVEETTTCDQACKAAGFDGKADREPSADGTCRDDSKNLIGYKWSRDSELPCCCKETA